MKRFLVVLLVIAAVCADESGESKDKVSSKYTTKYDGINLDEILQSDRLFDNYYQCMNGEGKCTPDGRELKRLLPDALQTECSKCSENQKKGVEKVIRFMIDNKEKEWKVLQAIYDPEGIYTKKYRPEAEKHGIKVEN